MWLDGSCGQGSLGRGGIGNVCTLYNYIVLDYWHMLCPQTIAIHYQTFEDCSTDMRPYARYHCFKNQLTTLISQQVNKTQYKRESQIQNN